MRSLRIWLSVVSAMLAAVLALPSGGAQASPPSATRLALGDVTATVQPGSSVALRLARGTLVLNTASNTLSVLDAKRTVAEIVPLGPVKANVARDGRSAILSGVPGVVPHRASAAKNKAYADMMSKLNRNWPCAAPATITGGVIGFVVGLILIDGWLLTAPVGAGIGAYVGYSNCRGGETIRAIEKWLNTP